MTSWRDPEDPRSDEDVAACESDDVAWRAERPQDDVRPSGAWRHDPPTERQVKYLLDLGYPVPATKGEAADILKTVARYVRPRPDPQPQPQRWWNRLGRRTS